MLNERLSSLERKIEYLEAWVSFLVGGVYI